MVSIPACPHPQLATEIDLCPMRIGPCPHKELWVNALSHEHSERQMHSQPMTRTTRVPKFPFSSIIIVFFFFLFSLSVSNSEFSLTLRDMTTLHLKISPASSFPVSHGVLRRFDTIHCSAQRIEISGNGNGSTNGKATFPEKDPLIRQVTSAPPRPRRIILVRHGQSEGNVDESVYTRVADPKIGLTDKGKAEAEAVGWKIREMIEKDGADDWKVYFYVSPYRRTLETLRNLGRAFERSRIAGMREETRLREQDFGNFQDREKMRVEKQTRIMYGRFFYRFPDGESAADVYDRITGFRETLRADIDIGRFQPPGERSQNMNLVIVSHGLTLRVFLMRWYKWTSDQFEGLNNLGNGKMIVMERGYGGRYSLLMQQTEEELREFGLTEDMLVDQEWQKYAKPGELNYDCPMLNSFFTHFGNERVET